MAQEFHSGEKSVPTAGTPVRLRQTRTECRYFVVQAKGTNTGNIYIRGYGELGGIELMPWGTHTFNSMGDNPHFNLREIYLDSATSGDGANLAWFGE